MAIPQDSVKISNSANGKIRVVTVTGINIRLDLNEIKINTVRRFFESDPNDIDGIGIELTGKVDFLPYERQLVANNDDQHKCNPSTGVSCYPQTTVDADGNTITTYTDALGNVVDSPIGLFDFFKPLLSQPVAILSLVLQQANAEDQVYHTWDK